jgi:hypothetical protein
MAELIGKSYVITEYYNVPFNDVFRYKKRWCVKIFKNWYKLDHNEVLQPITTDTLVVIHIKQFPKNKLYEIR